MAAARLIALTINRPSAIERRGLKSTRTSIQPEASPLVARRENAALTHEVLLPMAVQFSVLVLLHAVLVLVATAEDYKCLPLPLRQACCWINETYAARNVLVFISIFINFLAAMINIVSSRSRVMLLLLLLLSSLLSLLVSVGPRLSRTIFSGGLIHIVSVKTCSPAPKHQSRDFYTTRGAPWRSGERMQL
ncbi:Adenylate cyclase type 8 [Liparis tanakae]|uniref:Adenylate cyclase type 8 n=1 Tax=Liparis tanakae TaxID=230148 RepID=A0A4Z2E7Z3_9TELE|nr:Adenylate cyclase type 8 [Liparis tanakae]